MPSSAEISRGIYERLGAEGLASRTTAAWDDNTVRRVLSLLPPRRRILDLGCGYGRIAVPLAAAGHEVVGLDICGQMLDQARARAVRAGVDVQWHLGDLCQSPFPSRSFDVVLCLWLTFNELLRRDEQLAALREMCRVLRGGGFALLDGPPYSQAAADRDGPPQGSDVESDELVDDGISRRSGVPAASPVAAAFDELLAEAGARRHELFIDDCPGRPRHFLRFWAPD